jgi:hypothetical protein
MKKLQTAVKRAIGADYKEDLRSVRRFGAKESGVPGFIYSDDMAKFAKKNMRYILEAINQETGNILPFVCRLCPEVSPDDVAKTIFGKGTNSTVFNALSWYALATVAQTVEP